MLESLVYPTAAQLAAVDPQASSGTLEIAPMLAPLTLFVWSKNRIVPVRVTDFSITEEAFDPALNPIRAKVSLGLRVLSIDDLGFAHQGRQPVHGLPAEQGAARRQGAVGQLRDARHRRDRLMDPVQAFLQANALTPPAFPPTSRYYGIADVAARAGRRHAPIVLRAAALRAAAGELRAAADRDVVAGDRLDNLAARYLGDPEQFWRLCDANGAMRPEELVANVGADACASRCPKACRECDAMLAKGIQLTLMIGPVVPVPVPRVVMDALDSVEVRTAAGAASGFQLTLPVHQQVRAQHDLPDRRRHSASIGTPPLRVMLIVTLNGTPQPLFDGVMTNVEVQAGSQGSPGTVTVTGEDLTKVMDMQDFSGLPFPAMPIEARVALICAKYAVFGIIPLVIPILFPDVPIPIDKIPAQQGTDLQYIQQLADDVGYVFYIEPGPAPGTNVAYLGPEIKVGVPQPALNVDMDALTNVESLSFTFDPTKGVLPIVFIQNQLTRVPIPIPIPNLNPLQPPLGVLPTPISEPRRC